MADTFQQGHLRRDTPEGPLVVAAPDGETLPVDISGDVFVEVTDTVFMQGVTDSAIGQIDANGDGDRVSIPCSGFSGGLINYGGAGTSTAYVFEVSVDGGLTFRSTTATRIQPAAAADIETTAFTGGNDAWVVTLPPGATHMATYSLFGQSGTTDVTLVVGTLKSPNAQLVKILDALHDAVNTTQTTQVGGHATVQGTPPTAVAAGDRARLNVDTRGAVRTIHGAIDIQDGRKTVAAAGTREALAASTPCLRVMIQAETDNTGVVVFGDAATVVAALATRRGIALNAGEKSEWIEVDNLADIGLDVATSGDGVTYVYTT